MNPFTLEDQPRVETPQEELARLREVVQQHTERVRESGIEMSPRTATHEVIQSYVDTTPTEVLHPQYELKDHEAEEIVLNLSPEKHDQQIELLLGVVEEKGIRNAITVAEKMKNPHLMDDFFRVLVQCIIAGFPIRGLTESDPLWKPLHMTLFEVSLPETSEEDKKKQLKELISGMNQLYLGLLSIVSDTKNRGWFALEIANPSGTEQVMFYVAVPTSRKDLLEKQVGAVFPRARVVEHKDDYNMFNESGVSVASSAHLMKHPLYPLKSYEEFDVDPLGVILSSFSKLDTQTEGAAIQLVVGTWQDEYAKACSKALERIRKGDKIDDALGDVDRGIGGHFLKDIGGMFKDQKKIDKEKEDKTKRSQALDQAVIEQFTAKLKSPFVSANIRIVASSTSESQALNILSDIESSFNQFENGRGNYFGWDRVKTDKLNAFLEQFSLRTYSESQKMILSINELTTCLHFPASSVNQALPQLKQNKAGTAPAPLDIAKTGTLLGTNIHRSTESSVYIGPEDRMRHFYVIGQTGTGKTALLKNMIVQDIESGHGVCFIDPHGSDVMDILANIPPERYEDVIYFDPASTERPMALNMLEYDPAYPEQKTFVVNEMFSIFQKLYGAVPESMGPMFEQYFRNATMLVIEDPESGSTLLDVSRVMSNKAFRDLKISKCKNPVVVQFWKEIAEKAGGEASLANIVPYITSKFDVFLANEIMRPIIAQEKSSFSMRDVMDNKKILLINLSKGRLGDINSHLIGLILVGKILMSALSRVDSFGKPMSDFFLYLDEFQNITTDSIATILSEARKYRLSMTIAHQFIGQLEDSIKDAVLGNVGSLAVFRVGTEDAEFFEKQFAPTFTKSDIINLDNFNAYVKLLSGGRPTKPFNIVTIAPSKGNPDQTDSLKQLSALMFGRPRAEVEEEVMAKYQKK
ncbi:MAG: type IV secretory system conjugative DNA transfer family protein [Candidatus Taylorbacteria bacterium]